MVKHLSTKNELPISNWNVGLEAQKYVNYTCDTTVAPIEFSIYIDVYTAFFKDLTDSPEKFDWSTSNIGTLITKFRRIIIEQCLEQEWNEKTNNFFKLPSSDMSILDFIMFFVVKDFRAFDLPNVGFPIMEESLKSCLKQIDLQSDRELANFPCQNLEKFTACLDYCEAHQRFTNNSHFHDQILTFARFAMPLQRKLHTAVSEHEKVLASKLFGHSAVRNEELIMGPTPLVLFCSRRDTGYVGEETYGLSEKLCDEFFPTPTDDGMCMTQNLDVKEFLKDYKAHDILFESAAQNPPPKILEGSFWSEKTLIIQTFPAARVDTDNEEFCEVGVLDAGHPITNDKSDMDSIQMQIHHNLEMAHILQDNQFTKDTSSISLKRGYEYFIDIIPIGQISTNRFKELSKEQRHCLLKDEVNQDSMFKMYSKENCKYECHVKLAMDACRCSTWDFLHDSRKMSYPECDVFGRTCFFETMKNLSLSNSNHCPQCLDECESIKYKMMITKSVKSNLRKPVTDLLLNANNTFLDKGVINSLAAISVRRI